MQIPSRTLAAVVATALIALPGAAFAANPELRLPDFSHLESKARESVNITIDGYVMRLAKAFAAKQEGGANPALGLLDDIRSVQVKSARVFCLSGSISRRTTVSGSLPSTITSRSTST